MILEKMMFDWLKNPLRRSFRDYPDHVRTAAFRWIGMPSVRPSYLGGTLDQIDRLKAHSARKRADAASLQNDELRECVLAWLDYYDRRSIPEDEVELRDQITKRGLDAYKAERAIEEKKVADLLNSAR